jgi:hypothetical protein
MQRGNQRLQVSLLEELNLVHQEDDSIATRTRYTAHFQEQLSEVILRIAGIRDAGNCIDIDANLYLAVPDDERAQDTKRAPSTVPNTLNSAHLEKNTSSQPGHHIGELSVLADLGRSSVPTRFDRDVGEGVEQHRLPYAAKSSDEHALLVPICLEATDQDPEALKLIVSTGQSRGLGPSSRRVRIADRVHERNEFYTSIGTYVEFHINAGTAHNRPGGYVPGSTSRYDGSRRGQPPSRIVVTSMTRSQLLQLRAADVIAESWRSSP